MENSKQEIMREVLTEIPEHHYVNLEMLSRNALIIDAGASRGYFSKSIKDAIKIHQIGSKPIIYAIEPNKNNICTLKQIEGYPNEIILIEKALVGEKEKNEKEFIEIEGLPGWGNVNGLYRNRKHVKYMVKTINLKSLLEIIPGRTIDFFKMDIEGSENDVISEMNKETANRIRQISFEVHHVSSLKELTEKLQSLGYKTYYEEGELYAAQPEC